MQSTDKVILFDLDEMPEINEDTGTFVHLRGLKNEPLFTKNDAGEIVPLGVTQAGTYSKRFRAIADHQRDRLLRQRRHQLTAEQLTANQLELTSGCSISWNLKAGGKPIELTPENASLVYVKCPHWREQVEEVMGDHAGFLKAVSTS